MSLLFSPFTFHTPGGPLTLSNRIVVAPMCQYSADEGRATDWHLMHWGNLLNSGAALFTIEATAVTREGRITPGCLDRKSTRLNSSHITKSYAVFRLKKKNEQYKYHQEHKERKTTIDTNIR